jgi:hypothetical protein
MRKLHFSDHQVATGSTIYGEVHEFIFPHLHPTHVNRGQEPGKSSNTAATIGMNRALVRYVELS